MTRTLPAHFVRFLLIGLAGTALHFVVLAAGVKLARVHPVLASQCGVVAGATLNYILSRRLNYGTAASHVVTAPRFFAVAGVGFVLNGLLMTLFIVHWRFGALPAQCLTTSLVLLWNFMANHFWTFRQRPLPGPPSH